MMKLISAFISGVIFSIGLTVAGMTDPVNVIGFLDITGQWNPALMLVLIAAIVVTAIGYRLVWKRTEPLFEENFFVPTSRIMDGRLMTGAAIFGIGWGLVGLCPGPALSSVVSGESSVLVFIGAMLGGMLLQRGVSLFIENQTKRALSV